MSIERLLVEASASVDSCFCASIPSVSEMDAETDVCLAVSLSCFSLCVEVKSQDTILPPEDLFDLFSTVFVPPDCLPNSLEKGPPPTLSFESN